MSAIFEYLPGAVVVEEGQIFDGIYIVKEGLLEVSRTDEDGNKVPLGLIKKGEFVGDMAYFMTKEHTTTVRALSKSTLTKLPKPVLDKQLKETPKWMVALTTNLIARLKKVNQLMVKHKIKDEELAKTIRAYDTQDH